MRLDSKFSFLLVFLLRNSYILSILFEPKETFFNFVTTVRLPDSTASLTIKFPAIIDVKHISMMLKHVQKEKSIEKKSRFTRYFSISFRSIY